MEGDRRGASLGGLKFGGAGGINLGEVARTTRVTRSDRTAGVTDRWLASEVSLAIGAENPLRYFLGEWVEDVD